MSHLIAILTLLTLGPPAAVVALTVALARYRGIGA